DTWCEMHAGAPLPSFIIALCQDKARRFGVQRVTNPPGFAIICSYDLLKGVTAYPIRTEKTAQCRALRGAHDSDAACACARADADCGQRHAVAAGRQHH